MLTPEELRERKRLRDKVYYQEHKEQIKETVRKYRNRDRQKYLEHYRNYYKTLSEEKKRKMFADRLARYEKDKDAVRAQLRAYYRRQVQENPNYNRDRYYKDPRCKIRNRLRRLNKEVREQENRANREAYARGEHHYALRLRRITLVEVSAVEERNKCDHGGVLWCYLCDRAIGDVSHHIEHKTPIFKGGTNDPLNLDIAHCYCNLMKRAMTASEWFQSPTYLELMKDYEGTIKMYVSGGRHGCSAKA